MGTDIHLFAEVRQPNGSWLAHCNPDETPHEFDIERNYNLFAILADVRNAIGFAGVQTALERLSVIAEPRGLPDKLSPAIFEAMEYNHTHSWLMLEEILSFDWTQLVQKTGLVSWAIWQEWQGWARDRGEQPKGWAGDVWGPGIKIISEEEAQILHKNETLLAEQNTYHLHVRSNWTISYPDTCKQFWHNIIPRLLHLGKPDLVRLTFSFDS